MKENIGKLYVFTCPVPGLLFLFGAISAVFHTRDNWELTAALLWVMALGLSFVSVLLGLVVLRSMQEKGQKLRVKIAIVVHAIPWLAVLVFRIFCIEI